MAVACLLPRLDARLRSSLQPAVWRRFSSAKKTQPNRKTAEPSFARRYLPDNASTFFKGGSGLLVTTPENRQFLLQHGIEPDNGKMKQFRAGSDSRGIASKYGVSLAFSPQHVLHPYDLRFFDPKGHPLAHKARVDYARKVRDHPLWIMTTTISTASPVVKNLTKRRLVAGLHRALEDLGYDLAPGLGRSREIRGTFWISMFNPAQASANPPEEFGKAIAAALDALHGRER
ncbi:hypothetical protein CDD83_1592 [Cordyceps sp. RAO-2017]|nr:hypothetical protein CDD83_1592 [Cordyceps sp. RAO-2017]